MRWFIVYKSLKKSDGNSIKEQAARKSNKVQHLAHELMNFSLLDVASERQRKDVEDVCCTPPNSKIRMIYC